MRHPFALLLGYGLLLFAVGRAPAQDVAEYPPAAGHMTVIPPSFPAPGGVGGEYVETFPAAGQTYQPDPYVAQPTPYVARPATPAAPRVIARPRARLQRGVRVYSRGYNAAPAPYATPLPQSQLGWPGTYLAPGYTPFSRYQTYGQGYEQSPYGSNFWGGYYKGFSLGY